MFSSRREEQLLASQETTKRFWGACDACHNNISGKKQAVAKRTAV
jgi:hypothetical protein